MKNIFKNLMLVAVAAMTFTACQKDNEETKVNKGEESACIVFTAKISDETRSGFTGTEVVDGTTYHKSEWTGDEDALFIAMGSWNTTYTDITLNGNDATFSVPFKKDNLITDEEIVACTPSSSWEAKQLYNQDGYWQGFEAVYTIPSEQTPTATSVDPKAHILKASVNYGSNYTLVFKHQVAYGKLSIKDLNLGDDKINKVILAIDENSYSITTSATDNIWFACEPNGTVTNMSVTVRTDSGKEYFKTIVEDANKTLAFNKGKVSTFAVSMENSTAGEAEAFDGTIKSWKCSGGVWDPYKVTGDNFSFDLKLYYAYTDYLYYRSTGYVWGDGGLAKNFYVSNVIAPAIGVGTLTPSTGTLNIKQEYSSGEIHDVTIILTINDIEYTFTYYGYIGGEAVEKGNEPVKLATPTLNLEVSGNTITAKWDDVTGASNYTVTLNNGTPETVNGTEKVFENLDYSTEYTVTVVANPADAVANIASEATSKSVTTTDADPNAGGGSEPKEPSEIALTSVIYEYGSTDITFNSASDTITGTISYSGAIPSGDFTVVGGEPTTGQIGNVKLNGSAVTPEGTVKAVVNYGTGCIDFTVSIVINGTTYNGTVSAKLQ